MTMTAAPVALPPRIARLLAEFCQASKTGNLQIDIKDGNIVSFKLTEIGTVDRSMR